MPGSFPQPGAVWGPYEVVTEIARGGMARVFAVHPVGEAASTFAMKILRPGLVEEEGFTAMFVDEARIASAIRHPNVVRVFDVDSLDGIPFMVMELLHGVSLYRLRKRLKGHGDTLPVGPGLDLLAQTALGLHAAHECVAPDTGEPLHIVHRDVSPQNIHVGHDGCVRVLDFGIAAAKGRLTETRTGLVKGKFGYLAPEQITREVTLDRRVDVWALGVVAWELFADRRLFRREDDATTFWSILHDPIPRLDSLRDVPVEVAELVHQCLSRDHEQRPATCEEVAKRFQDEAKRFGNSRGELGAVARAAGGESPRPIEPRGLATVEEAPEPPDSTVLTVVHNRSGKIPIRAARRSWIFGAVFLLGTVGALAVAWSTVRETKRQRDPSGEDTMITAEAMPVSVDSVTDSEASTASETEVHVDPTARLVLVNGARREERPLRLRLRPDEVATVDLVTDRGEIVSHLVRTSDHGTRLSLDRSTPPRTERPAARRHHGVRRRARRGRSSSASNRGVTPAPTSMLLRNPY